MSQDILGKITNSMSSVDDLKNAGISFETLDLEEQREVLIKLMKNNLKNMDKLKQDYADLKKKHPDIHIDFFEEH